MKKYEEVIREIAKQSGEVKYGSWMRGDMLPRGLSELEIGLCLGEIFELPVHEVIRDFRALERRTFEERRNAKNI